MAVNQRYAKCGYYTPVTGKPGGRGETMFTLNSIGSMTKRSLRLLRQEWRRVVSFVVAFTFTFTMTGLNAIIAHAYDDYKQYSGSKLEVQRDALMTGTNPADNTKPDAFVDVANPDSLNTPANSALSDTSLNVLKSEYGSLLDTVSLQTLAERSSSGMDLSNMVNEMIGQPATGLQPVQPTLVPEQPAATVPLVDPATAADIVTLQQGPLGMSLEMDNADPSQIPAGDTKDLARLPMPAGALKDNQPTAPTETVEIPEQDTPVVESPQTPDVQLAALPTNPDVLQPNVIQTNNIRTEDQQLPDQNQVQVPEEQQPDQQNVVLPKDQQQPDQNTDSSQNGNLSQQFMALLGLNPTTRTESMVVPQVGVENQEPLVTAASTDQTVVTPADQGDQPPVAKPQAETVVDQDGQPVVQTEEPNPTQPDQQVAQNPDQQQPDQEQPVQPGDDKKPKGDDQDQPGTQPANLMDQLKAFLGMDVTTPDRTETNVVETTGAEDLALPEIPANNLVQTSDVQPTKDVNTRVNETEVPKVEVAAKPDEEPTDDKKPTDTVVDEEDTTQGEEQGEDEELTDQVLSMLGMPAEDEGGPATLAVPDTDLDVTLVDIDLPAPDITATSVLGADTVKIDVNALMVDQVQLDNDVVPVENDTPSPVLVETPRVEPVETDVPLVRNDQPVVQNSQFQNNDQLGICMVGPDATLRDQNQSDPVQPVASDNEVQAASLVVNPNATLRDPAQATVNPLLATNPLSTNAGYTPINNQGNNLIASLPNTFNQGGLIISSTQTFNPTVQTALTVPTIRPVIQPATVQTQPQLGVATQTMPQMYDVNMVNFAMLSSSTPAPGTIGTIVPAGSSNNVVTMVATAVQAANNPNQSIPPQPTFQVTNTTLPWSTYEPVDAATAGEEYRAYHEHHDPPKDEGGGGASGCAKFMASPLGKILMFVVTVVLTIFTVGTAAPILLAIMIILEAILAFVPLPPALAITLGVALAFLGGWASALNSLATTTAAVANITVSQAMTQIISQAGGLLGTLLIKSVATSIIKAVVARIIVDLFLMLCPEASPILTALVAIAAGAFAGGVAEMIVNGKGFVEAFKFALKEPLNGFLEKPNMATMGRLLASPFMLQLYQVVLEEVVVQIMVNSGYTDTYARQIGSMVSAFAVGALSYGLNRGASPEMLKFTTLVVVQPIAMSLSTWYSTEVGGLLREQGYSSIQTMHFAQTVSGAINLLAPSQRLTVDIRTGEKKWIVTNDLLEGLKALAGDRKVITVPRGSENIVEAATQKPAPTTPVTPALEPKVAIALQSPGLDGTVTTLGTRQAMPENGQLVALPVAARQGMTEAGPTVMPEMETAVMLGTGTSGPGSLGGVQNGVGGTGSGVGGVGVGPQGGVVAAANVGLVTGTETLLGQGTRGLASSQGDLNTPLNNSSLSPLRTDDASAPRPSADAIVVPTKSETTNSPTTSPDVKITDVSRAVEQPVQQPLEQSSANPKPSNVQDLGGDTSKPNNVETNRPATDNKVPDLKPNIQPDNMTTNPDAPKTNPQQQQTAPQQLEAPKTESNQQTRDESAGRNLSSDTPRMDESKAGNLPQTEIKDLKSGDALKFEDPNDKAAKGGDISTASGNGGQTEDVAKNNNRILENSGEHSDAFVPRDPNQTPSPTQASSSSPQPAEVQGLARKLQDSYILPKNENYSYSQTQNAQGQTLTQIFNKQGQVIGAQVDLGNGNQITKTFDYQPVPQAQGAGAAVAPGAVQVKTLTMENGNITEMQVSRIEGDKLNVIDRKTPLGATGLNSTQGNRDLKVTGDSVERRNDDGQASAANATPKGPGSQSPTTTQGGDATGTSAGKVTAPAEGSKVSVTAGTPEQPVKVDLEFHQAQANQAQDIKGSDGKWYRAGYDAAGKVQLIGEVQFQGSFFSFKDKETILIPQGQTTGYGDQGNIYDCSSGSPRLIKGDVAASFTDSQGQTVKMHAPISVGLNNLPKDVQQAMVMVDNLSRTGANALPLTELQKTEMATRATSILQQHASTQTPGTAGYQQAMEFTYQAEQRLYSQNTSQQLLTQMSQHAVQSNNPELMMNAAELQFKAGQTQAGVQNLQQALSSATQLSTNQQAAMQLAAANLLQAAGQSGAFQQSMGEAASYLNGLQGKQVPPEAMAMALQYESMAGKARANGQTLPEISSALSNISQNLDQQVRQAGSNLLEGQQRSVPELNGTVVRTQDGYNLLQKGANNTMVTTQFNQGGASQIDVRPATGGESLQVYRQVDGRMQLTDQRTTVQTTADINGQKQNRIVEALLPVDRPVTKDNPTGALQKLIEIDGQNYTLTVGQDNQGTAVLSHKPDADTALAYQQQLPNGRLELNADNTATFRTASGEAINVQGKVLTMADMDAMGIKGAMATDLVGKMAFTLTLPNKGAVTFVGSAAEIQAGNYSVLGTNKLTTPMADQPTQTRYTAQYQNNNLSKVSVMDQFQTTINYQTADLSKFTVTQVSEDGMQVATMRYENNQLQGREVVHRTFGVTFQCDAKGNLTAESKEYLQKNSAQGGYTYKETSQGFSLVNNQTKVEQFFSANGRLLLNPGQGGTGGGVQKFMEFDVKQATNLQVAKYDNGNITAQNVRFEQITQQVVLLQESNGLVIKTVQKSDVAGSVHERVVVKADQVMTETGSFKISGELDNGTRQIKTLGVIQESEKGLKTVGDMNRTETVKDGAVTERITDITNRAQLNSNGTRGPALDKVNVRESGAFTADGAFSDGTRTTRTGNQVVTEKGSFNTTTGDFANGTRNINVKGMTQNSTVSDMSRTETVRDGIITGRTTDLTNRANLNADGSRGTALANVKVNEIGTFAADGAFANGTRTTSTGNQVVTEKGSFNTTTGDFANGTRNINVKGMAQNGTVGDMRRTEKVDNGLVTQRTTDITNRANLNADGSRGTALANVKVNEIGTFTADGAFANGTRTTSTGNQVVTEKGSFNTTTGDFANGTRNINVKGMAQNGTIGDMSRTEKVDNGLVTQRTTDITNRANLNANGSRGTALPSVNVKEVGTFTADGTFANGTRTTSTGNQVVTEKGSFNTTTGDFANGTRNINVKGMAQNGTVGDMSRTETVRNERVTQRTTDITNRANLNANGSRGTALPNVNVKEVGTFTADGAFVNGTRTTSVDNQVVAEKGSFNTTTGDFANGTRNITVKGMTQNGTIGDMSRIETVRDGIITGRTTDITNRANLNANGSRGAALPNVNVKEIGTFTADGAFAKGSRITTQGNQVVTENGSYNAKTGDLLNGTQEVRMKQQQDVQKDVDGKVVSTTTNSGVVSVTKIVDGKVVDITTTIQSTETRNAKGEAVGRETGVKKALVNPVFNEVGTLVSGKQIMRVAERVEINTETGSENVSKDVVSTARIERGRVVASSTQIGESFTRNASGRVTSESQFGVIQNFKLVSVYTPGVFGSDGEVGINITQAKDGSTVIINGNQEKAVAMGAGVQVRAEANKIIVEDARGVLKTFDPRGNETTSRWQNFKNAANEYVDKVNVAWEGLSQAWSQAKDFGSIASAIGSTLVWAVKVTAAFTVFVLQEAWYAVEGAISVSINLVVAPITLLYTAGKNLINGNPITQGMFEAFNAPGNGVVNGIKAGLNFVFGYVDKGLNAVSAKMVGWSEQALDAAENAADKGQTGKAIALSTLATAAKIVGENLPTLVIIAVSFIPYVGPAIAMTMLARDALNRGLGHMFQSFFIEPVTKIIAGVGQLISVDDASRMSTTRQTVNAMSLIGGGLVGLALAGMMLKGAVDMYRAARGEVAMGQVKSYMQKMADTGRVGELVGKTLGEIAKDAGLTKVKLDASWAGKQFGDLVIPKLNTTIAQLIAKPGGLETLAKFITEGAGGKGFRINDLSLPEAKQIKTSALQKGIEKATEALYERVTGKKLQTQNRVMDQPLGEAVKPSQLGLNPLTGMGSGIAAFMAGTIKAQFEMMYNSFKTISSMTTSVLRATFNGARTLIMEKAGVAYSPAYQRVSQAVGQATQRFMSTSAGRALQNLSPSNVKATYNRVAEAARNFSFSQFRNAVTSAFRELASRLTQPESVRLAGQGETGGKAMELAAARQAMTEAAGKGESLTLPKAQTVEEAPTGRVESARGESQAEGTVPSGARQKVVTDQTGPSTQRTGAGTEATSPTKPGTASTAPETATKAGSGTDTAVRGNALTEGQRSANANVRNIEGTQRQLQTQLADAHQKGNTAEVGRLTEAIRTNETALTTAKAEVKIADLQAGRSKAEAAANDPARTPLEKAQASAMAQMFDGLLKAEGIQKSIAAVEAEIAKTETRAATEPEQAKAELSAQRTKLNGLQEQLHQAEQLATLAKNLGQARMDQMRLQGELANANGRLEQARLPEDRQAASTSIRRIEREITRSQAAEKFAQAQQKVLDCQAEVARARAAGNVDGVVNALQKLHEASTTARYGEIELASAQNQFQQAQARENQQNMSGQLDQMAQASGMSRQTLEAKVDQMADSLGPKSQRQALKEAMVDLMSGNSRNPLEAMQRLEQGSLGLKAFMDALLANGMQAEAMNFLGEVGKAQGANAETRNAAAEAFGMQPRGLESELGRQFGQQLKAENPEGRAEDGSRSGMSQAERKQLLRDVSDNLTLQQYDRLVKAQLNGENITDVLKAIRTEGAGRSLAEVLSGDPAARSRAFADQLTRSLSDAGVDMNASRRQMVNEVAKNMTLEGYKQLNEKLLTSSDPAGTLEKAATSPQSLMPAKATQALAAERLLGGDPAKMESSYSPQSAQELAAFRAELGKSRSVEQALRTKDSLSKALDLMADVIDPSAESLAQARTELSKQGQQPTETAVRQLAQRTEVRKLTEGLTQEQALRLLNAKNSQSAVLDMWEAQQNRGEGKVAADAKSVQAQSDLAAAKTQADVASKALEAFRAELKAQGGEPTKAQADRLGELVAQHEAAQRSLGGAEMTRNLAQKAQQSYEQPSLQEQLGSRQSGKALATLDRIQQVEQARQALHEAKTRYNQATTYAEKVAAEKVVQTAQRELRVQELMAERKPAVGNRLTEAWAHWRADRGLASAERVQLRINVSEAVSSIKDPILKAQMTEQLLRFNDLQKAIEADQVALDRAGRFGGSKAQIEARMMENIKQRQNLLADINKSGNVSRLLESMELQGMIGRQFMEVADGAADPLGGAIKKILGEVRGELLQPQALAKATGVDEAIMVRLCERIGQSSELLSPSVVREVIKAEFPQLKGQSEKIIQAMTEQLGGSANFKFPALGKGLDAMTLSERRAQIEAKLNESDILKQAGVELNGQSRAIMTELIMQFQMDPAYRFYTPELPMLRFLARQAELHYLNMELQVKNPAMKAVIGEALQLAMGGGKSCSPIALKVALDLFAKNHPNEVPPAMLYMTANATLVKQIISDNAVFGRMNTIELAKDGTPEQMAAFKRVVEGGFEKGKMYVTDNETLKQIVLEMRSNGKSDAQIAKLLQRDLGTVAWDEFHAAFHTTDTIIGASGIVPHLSAAAMSQLLPVTLNLLAQYAKVREWFMGNELVRQGRESALFVNAEQGVGKEIRAQFRFTEAAKQQLLDAGILDYRKPADAFILDKIAQTLSMKNGREYSGHMTLEGRIEYGTMEGGVGKPNTIFGDQMLATFTNAEIFLAATKLKAGDLMAENFTSQYRPFMESMIEAFVHTTTERVTMMEAMHLVGSHNIVGFSGTFEGIQNVLQMWGKQLVRVNTEPVIDVMQVLGHEAYYRVKVGEDVLTLTRDMRSGEVKLTLGQENITANKALVEDILSLMGQRLEVRGLEAGQTIKVDGVQRTVSTDWLTNGQLDMGKLQARFGESVTVRDFTNGKLVLDGVTVKVTDRMVDKPIQGAERTIRQQIVTGDYNAALGELMLQVETAFRAQHRATESVEISRESLKKFIVEKNIEVPRERGVDVVDALFKNEKLVNDVMGRMLQHPGQGKVQLIRIDGIAPELWTFAMKALEKAIKTPEGCMQERVIFAPKIGEGLNTVSIKPGAQMDRMGAALHQLDMRPLDVYRQTMKRLNVYEVRENGLDFRRAQGVTGMSLDYNRLKSITGSESREMAAFIDEVRSAMGEGTSLGVKVEKGQMVTTTEIAQRNAELIKRFNDLLIGEGRVQYYDKATGQTELVNRNYSTRTEAGVAKAILTEVDTQKARAAQQTQAGIQTEATVEVGVAKDSAQYMPTLAKKVESNIPEILRKFQGLSDLEAARNGSPVGSQLMGSPAMTSSALQSRSSWSGYGWLANFVDSRISALKTSSSTIQLVGEYSRTWQNPEWQQQHPQQVAALQQQFGSDWFAPAMTSKFGTDWRLYEKLGNALAIQTQGVPVVGRLWFVGQPLSNLVAAMQVDRQLRTVPKQEYQAAVRNIARVSEQLPQLNADPANTTLTYQGQTMTLPQAQRYLRGQMDIVRTATEVYGFKPDKLLQGLSQVRENTAYNTQELSAAAVATLKQTAPAVRFMQSAQQKWGEVIRHMQEAKFLAPFFKVQNGWIVPSTVGSLVIGAAAVAALSFTGLPILGLAAGLLLTPLLQPMFQQVSRFLPGQMGAAMQASSGRRMSLMGRVVPAVLMSLVIGAVSPVQGMTNAVSAVTGAIVETSLSAKQEDQYRVTINHTAPKEALLAETGRSADQTVAAGKSLVETFKEETQEIKSDGGAVYQKLREIISRKNFGGVRLEAAATAQHYGYMHLLAAVISLVPKALDSVSAIDVGMDSIQSPENVVDGKDVSRIRVPKNSIRFLGQELSDVLLTQVLTAVVMNVFPDGERATLNEKLRQSGEFAEYGERAVVEFVKQYLLNGVSLQAWLDEAAGAKQGWAFMTAEVAGRPQVLNLYQIVQQRFGQVKETDLAEINQAMGELENEAVPLMAEDAERINHAESASAREAGKVAFEARFGITYENYQSMINPSLVQRLLLRVAGEAQLQGDRPVDAVRQFGWQMAGVGLAALAVGIVGIVTFMLGPIIGGAIAVIGAGVAVAGLWTLYRAQAVAFSVNPAGTVAEQMRKAEFRSEQDQWAIQNRVNTLQLLENREFSQAVAGLRIKGTDYLLSEQNRGRAVRAVLGQMVRVMESDAPQDMKLQLTRELTQVLGFLQFNFGVQVKRYGPTERVVTLTPEAQPPQAFKQDYKLGWLKQRLDKLGIVINMEVAPSKQPKLKLTGAAA
jgi:hypothetical protein